MTASEFLDAVDKTTSEATDGPWAQTYEPADRWVSITWQGRSLGSGLWMVCPEVATCEGEPGEDSYFIAQSRQWVPAMSAALRAVLELHKPHKVLVDGEVELFCLHCEDVGDWNEARSVAYPCPTVRAISDALGVEIEGGEK